MRITEPEVTLLAVTPRAEKLIEEAGRTCYLSFDKMDDTSEANFIRRCIKNGHHSILEHASASFRVRGASRAFTHQLVRHRVASFSQQSQRYVNEDEFNYVVPPDIQANTEASALFDGFLENARLAYRRLREMGIKKEDARFVLPNALESEIVFSANFRELRHVFALRCARGAQWEIRAVCLAMLRVMKAEAPSVFGDFVIDEESKTAKSVL
ncbi:MAG: FAD-dependent thymidylate synthase [Spirochaetes bacterium]|jgi:thymidylate synthase (FAD)|nr:FAD-dependent thymidylate synthase [Spirochaetota bacterium]